MVRRKTIWLAVVVLAITSVTSAAVVFAGDDVDKSSRIDSFPARVAHILELDEAVVADAMRQAKEELRADKIAALEATLAAMVESGELTQEEADAKLQGMLDGGKKAGSKTKTDREKPS